MTDMHGIYGRTAAQETDVAPLEVEEAILILEEDKSPGLDGICLMVLSKQCMTEMATPRNKIFMESLHMG